MRITRWLPLLALLFPGAQGAAQDEAPGALPEARIWLDRGDDPLLQRGDRVRIYYRTAADAYVAVFHIDTDGSVRLLNPRAPEDETFTRGGRDYRLLFPQSSYWYVDEYPGKGYFFLVASPEPLDLGGFAYARQERSWDLSRVGRTVYEDPYLAMDDYVAEIVPNWESVPFALDFIGYDVGEAHEYPRFLCYDCHGFKSYSTWNPYTYACASFRVVVWDDPYFYPTYRYRDARVVYVPPRRGVAMYEFKERAAGETWTPLVRTRQGSLDRGVQYAEPGAAGPPLREWVAPRRPNTTPDLGATQSDPRRPSDSASPALGRPPLRRGAPSLGATNGSEGTRGTGGNAGSSGEQRPTRSLVPPSAQPRRTVPPATQDRPVLQRRPTTGGSTARPSGAGTARPTTGSRPSGTVRPSNPGSRPSGGSTRVVPPSRSSGGASARPSVRPPTRSGGEAKPSRPPAKGATKPPPRRKPGGGA
jgi:hypothetical protein